MEASPLCVCGGGAGGAGLGVVIPHPRSGPIHPAVDKYIAMAKEKHGYNIEQVSRGPTGVWGGPDRAGVAQTELCPLPGQALGMLLWHKHDVEKSLADLANFTPFPDEWTVEDKVLFEQAFGFHGKCFQRIQQMVKPSAPAIAPRPLLPDAPARGPGSVAQPLALSLQLPDKLIPSLVKYYYSWKKTRSRTSVMDRQARRLGGRKDKEERWGGQG